MNDIKSFEKVKNIVFMAEGGLGKNIAATAVIKSIKEVYPDKNIIVLAGFQEIFFYNLNIKKSFKFSNPLYFFDDFINEESYVLKFEPYVNYIYINKQAHLIQSWCDSCNIPNKNNKPDLYLLPNELDAAKIYYDKLTEEGKKELILLQWIGGKILDNKDPATLKGALASMYRRALPQETAQEIVDILTEKGYIVGVIGHENFPQLKGATNICFPIRSVIALIPLVKTFIAIDSFLQHAAAATQINKKGIVCWAGTSPTCLGYDTHINLTRDVCQFPMCHRPNSYLFDIQPHGVTWDCPYGEPCTKYKADEIIKVFDENFEKKVKTKEETK